jgi:K+-sensing histidine kinase KdpD
VVVAGVSGTECGEPILRRASEVAEAGDAELVVVHVVDATGGGEPSDALAECRDLAHSLGASYRTVRSEDPVDGLTIAAGELGAKAVVVGRHRSRWVELLRGSVARRLRRRLPDMTVEIVEHD